MTFDLESSARSAVVVDVGWSVAFAIGSAWTGPASKPPKSATHLLKVSPEVINFGPLPVGNCPVDNFPTIDPSCAAMLRPIHVTNISDDVVTLGRENFNTFGFATSSAIWPGLCAVLPPGETCEITVFGHVLAPGVSWTYLQFLRRIHARQPRSATNAGGRNVIGRRRGLNAAEWRARYPSIARRRTLAGRTARARLEGNNLHLAPRQSTHVPRAR